MKTLKYLGHSCFLLSDGKIPLLFDPYISDSPCQVAKADDIQCKYILTSHGHFDHLGDTVAIAKRTGATVLSTAEVAGACGSEGCATHAMHLGGKHDFDFGTLRITLAFHGAGVPGGHACGFLVEYGGTTIYHAGDTALFGDMALLGRLEKIDYALLPIGDNFTMGPRDAVEAVAMLKPRFVVPMHYNTWPLIAQDPHAFKNEVQSRLSIPVLVVAPGETITLE